MSETNKDWQKAAAKLAEDLTALRAVADEMAAALCRLSGCCKKYGWDTSEATTALTRYAALKKENIQRSETGEARSL